MSKCETTTLAIWCSSSYSMLYRKLLLILFYIVCVGPLCWFESLVQCLFWALGRSEHCWLLPALLLIADSREAKKKNFVCNVGISSRQQQKRTGRWSAAYRRYAGLCLQSPHRVYFFLQSVFIFKLSPIQIASTSMLHGLMSPAMHPPSEKIEWRVPEVWEGHTYGCC